jgi:hypothetical protein
LQSYVYIVDGVLVTRRQAKPWEEAKESPYGEISGFLAPGVLRAVIRWSLVLRFERPSRNRTCCLAQVRRLPLGAADPAAPKMSATSS